MPSVPTDAPAHLPLPPLPVPELLRADEAMRWLGDLWLNAAGVRVLAGLDLPYNPFAGVVFEIERAARGTPVAVVHHRTGCADDVSSATLVPSNAHLEFCHRCHALGRAEFWAFSDLWLSAAGAAGAAALTLELERRLGTYWQSLRPEFETSAVEWNAAAVYAVAQVVGWLDERFHVGNDWNLSMRTQVVTVADLEDTSGPVTPEEMAAALTLVDGITQYRQDAVATYRRVLEAFPGHRVLEALPERPYPSDWPGGTVWVAVRRIRDRWTTAALMTAHECRIALAQGRTVVANDYVEIVELPADIGYALFGAHTRVMRRWASAIPAASEQAARVLIGLIPVQHERDMMPSLDHMLRLRQAATAATD